jgi:hypothetical protein
MTWIEAAVIGCLRRCIAETNLYLYRAPPFP